MAIESMDPGMRQRMVDEQEFRIAVHKLARRIRIERDDDSLTDAQIGLLMLLDRAGPKTPGQLAERERVTPQSITRTVNGLEVTGYVTRTPSADDARSVIVAITESGRAHTHQIRRLRNEWVANRISELTDAERGLLRAVIPVLRKLAEA